MKCQYETIILVTFFIDVEVTGVFSNTAPTDAYLFATCLVDLFRPSVGFAAIKLLEAGGARVEVPLTQTCCGQPAYNSGDRANAVLIARRVVDTFERFDYVVAPSGSCAGMLRRHYTELLGDDADYATRAEALAARCFELTSFLVEVLGHRARRDALPADHHQCAEHLQAQVVGQRGEGTDDLFIFHNSMILEI